jgi:hypothetical protein
MRNPVRLDHVVDRVQGGIEKFKDEKASTDNIS